MLEGKKTYIAAIGTAISAIGAFLTAGDFSLHAILSLTMILAGSGAFAALGAKVERLLGKK